MSLDVSCHAITSMQAAAGEAHPLEACGILLGELLDENPRITAFCETANVHPTPSTHFEIDPQALIDAHRAARKGGPQVVGYFHSHPSGPARPSQTDRSMAAGDGRIWAILGEQEGNDADAIITFWRDGRGGFTPLSYNVTGR